MHNQHWLMWLVPIFISFSFFVMYSLKLTFTSIQRIHPYQDTKHIKHINIVYEGVLYVICIYWYIQLSTVAVNWRTQSGSEMSLTCSVNKPATNLSTMSDRDQWHQQVQVPRPLWCVNNVCFFVIQTSHRSGCYSVTTNAISLLHSLKQPANAY